MPKSMPYLQVGWYQWYFHIAAMNWVERMNFMQDVFMDESWVNVDQRKCMLRNRHLYLYEVAGGGGDLAGFQVAGLPVLNPGNHTVLSRATPMLTPTALLLVMGPAWESGLSFRGWFYCPLKGCASFLKLQAQPWVPGHKVYLRLLGSRSQDQYLEYDKWCPHNWNGGPIEMVAPLKSWPPMS